METTPKHRGTRLDFAQIPWRDVLLTFGIKDEFLKKTHGPCPACGGKDRFRFANTHMAEGPEIGMWHCNQCGSGNGFELIRLVTGLPKHDIFRKLEDIVGTVRDKPLLTSRIAQTYNEQGYSPEIQAKRRKQLQKVWDEGKTPTGDDPVSRYLMKRVPQCDLHALCNNIRCHPGLKYFHADSDGKQRNLGRFPTMLLRVMDDCGKPINIHRTYLTEKGEKAPFDKVKKLMSGTRLLQGASICINQCNSRVLGVCEGYETGLAIATAYKYSINVQALISAGNLARASIPKDRFDRVVIFADHDDIDPRKGYRPGEHFAKELEQRLLTEGFDVVIKMPRNVKQDFADVWFDYCRMRCAKPV